MKDRTSKRKSFNINVSLLWMYHTYFVLSRNCRGSGWVPFVYPSNDPFLPTIPNVSGSEVHPKSWSISGFPYLWHFCRLRKEQTGLPFLTDVGVPSGRLSSLRLVLPWSNRNRQDPCTGSTEESPVWHLEIGLLSVQPPTVHKSDPESSVCILRLEKVCIFNIFGL